MIAACAARSPPVRCAQGPEARHTVLEIVIVTPLTVRAPGGWKARKHWACGVSPGLWPQGSRVQIPSLTLFKSKGYDEDGRLEAWSF
jgi:hypothetical protein